MAGTMDFSGGMFGQVKGPSGPFFDYGQAQQQVAGRRQDQGYQADLAARLQGQRDQAETERARIGADAATLGTRLKDTHFNQLLPLYQQMLGGGGGMMGPYTAGGASAGQPAIDAGPVYGEDQIQQQVNAARAQNDAGAAAQQRQLIARTTGQGFGADSPLVAALSNQANYQNRALNADTERETRMTAAGTNASHLLDAQKAREGQFASRQQEDIARRTPILGYQSQLLAALAGMT